MAKRLEGWAQRIRHGKYNSQFSGKLVPHVGQNRELELVLLGSRKRSVGKFWRDGNKSDTFCLELIEIQLQRAKCDIAERAPFSAVEGDQKESFLEEFFAGD